MTNRIARRTFLQAMLALPLASMAPRMIAARPYSHYRFGLSWPQFVNQMEFLANELAAQRVSEAQVAWRGLHWLQLLDVQDPLFQQAVNESTESGNTFWLWQRLIKQDVLNGGILNITSDNPVPLHDHPGATGLLRLLDGKAEVWQYDVDQQATAQNNDGKVVLKRVAFRVLLPGDTAVLTPNQGNIHTLESVSQDCRMLDFFIPPYERKKRTWYEPVDNNWRQQASIVCTPVSDKIFTAT